MDKSKHTDSQTKDVRSRTRMDDAQEIERLDGILQRIKKRTPVEPYVVSTPSDQPYIISRHQVDDFRRNTNFARNEARLDYMSFLYRDTSHMVLCLEAQTTGEDSAKLAVPTSQLASHPGTPSLGPKKKMTLAEYRNRNNGHVQSGPAGQSPAIASHQPQASSQTPNGDTKKPGMPAATVHTSLGTIDVKEEPAARATPKFNVTRSPQPSASTTKDVSTNLAPFIQPQQAEIINPSASVTTPGPGPDKTHLHSPRQVSNPVTVTKPAVEQLPLPETKPGIPRQTTMSPQKAHSNDGGANPKADRLLSVASDIRDSANVLPSLHNDQPTVALNGASDTNLDHPPEFETSSPLAPQWSPLTASGSFSPNSLKMSATTSRSSATSAELSMALPSDAAFELAEKQAKAGETQSQSKPDPESVIEGTQKIMKGTKPAGQVNGTSQSNGSAQRGRKRSHDDDEESTGIPSNNKRRKTPETLDDPPRTPKAATMSSTNSASLPLTNGKNNLLTPERPLKNGTLHAPNGSTTFGQDTTPKVSASEKRQTGMARKWCAEVSRLHALGKEFKRDYTKRLEAAKSMKPGPDKVRSTKLALIKGLESNLSFMMAFCAKDEEEEQISSWRATTGLIDQLKKNVGDYHLLKGLCHLLHSTCARRLVSLLSKISPSSLSDATTIEEHYTDLQKCIQIVEKCSTDADRLLPKSTLLKKYPATRKLVEAMPLVAPSTMSVVRMSLSFLGEWSKQQNVTWSSSVEEGLCAQL